METGEFEIAYRRHAGAVLGYARRCVGRPDIAEEIASEAFVELLRHMTEIDAQQLPSWLFTVVKNRAIDYWRRQKLEIGAARELRAAPLTATPVIDWDLLDYEGLNAQHRLCLTLRYVHGMTREEIAEFTGLREIQVKGYLRYGLEILRKALAMPRGGPQS